MTKRTLNTGTIGTAITASALSMLLAGPVFAGGEKHQGTTQTESHQGITQSQSGQTGAASQQQQPSMSSSAQVSKLLDQKVKNDQDQELGTINDLVLDQQSGQITHVILSSGGVMGVGGEQYAVPWDKIQLEQDKEYVTLTTSVDKGRLSSEFSAFEPKESEGQSQQQQQGQQQQGQEQQGQQRY